MAWNEPGNNGNKDNKGEDPWGSGGRGNDQGPPDLDEAIKKLTKTFGSLFGGSSGGGGNSSNSGGGGGAGVSSGLIAAAALLVVAAWGVFGFYQVNEAERGVVMRFGEIQDNVTMPGLRWNPPFIDEVTLVNIQQLDTRSYTNDMLTTDENILNLAAAVQYRIDDPVKFVIAVEDPILSLDNSSESAIRHVVGGTTMNEILTTGRDQVARDVQERLQRYMDVYNTGIVISQVNVTDAQPPEAVKSAFDDVIVAREDEEREQNQAQQYSNRVIPEARGEAQRAIEQANAYKEQVIAAAEGEASRFEQLLTEYRRAPEVTRQRLYIEALQEVMTNSSKIMIDVEGGNNMLYVPLDKIMEQNNSSLSNGNRSTQDLRDLATELAPFLPAPSNSNAVDRSRLSGTGRGVR